MASLVLNRHTADPANASSRAWVLQLKFCESGTKPEYVNLCFCSVETAREILNSGQPILDTHSLT